MRLPPSSAGAARRRTRRRGSCGRCCGLPPGRPLDQAVARPARADFLFLRRDRRLGPVRLSQGLAEAVRRAGPVGTGRRPLPVTPHLLRHTCATELADAGVWLPALMALMGHATPGMALRYVRHLGVADHPRRLRRSDGQGLPQDPGRLRRSAGGARAGRPDRLGVREDPPGGRLLLAPPRGLGLPLRQRLRDRRRLHPRAPLRPRPRSPAGRHRRAAGRRRGAGLGERGRARRPGRRAPRGASRPAAQRTRLGRLRLTRP